MKVGSIHGKGNRISGERELWIKSECGKLTIVVTGEAYHDMVLTLGHRLPKPSDDMTPILEQAAMSSATCGAVRFIFPMQLPTDADLPDWGSRA